MEGAVQSRRARLRAEAIGQIKEIALKQMAEGGASSIALRAIAREMGMTAGAIYSYFGSRDELITALTVDVYESLATVLEDSQRTTPPRSARDNLLAHAHAYRTWAIAHPDEFRLIYGDPVPGYEPPESGAARDAEDRLCATLLELVTAAQPPAEETPSESAYEWSDFEPGIVAMAKTTCPDLTPAAVALCLRVWSRMHGLVTLEIYGQLHHYALEPEKLYDADMLDLVRSLDFMEPASS